MPIFAIFIILIGIILRTLINIIHIYSKNKVTSAQGIPVEFFGRPSVNNYKLCIHLIHYWGKPFIHAHQPIEVLLLQPFKAYSLENFTCERIHQLRKNGKTNKQTERRTDKIDVYDAFRCATRRSEQKILGFSERPSPSPSPTPPPKMRA